MQSMEDGHAGLEKGGRPEKVNCGRHLCPAYADLAPSPNLWSARDRTSAFTFESAAIVNVLFLRLVVESDLAFLPVPLSRPTRKQFHPEFCDTSSDKRKWLWNREQ